MLLLTPTRVHDETKTIPKNPRGGERRSPRPRCSPIVRHAPQSPRPLSPSGRWYSSASSPPVLLHNPCRSSSARLRPPQPSRRLALATPSPPRASDFLARLLRCSSRLSQRGRPGTSSDVKNHPGVFSEFSS